MKPSSSTAIDGQPNLWSCVLDAAQARLPASDVRAIAETSAFIEQTRESLRIRVADAALGRWIEAGWIGELSAVLGDHLAVLGDHLAARGDHLAVSGDHLAVRGDHLAVRGDHLAVRGDHLAVRGDHLAVRGDHLAVRGDHLAVRGDHLAVRGDHLAVSGDHLAVSGGSSPRLAISPARAQSLEGFASSGPNRETVSRARRIAARPDRCPGLHLLHGPGGAGKTHLLQGIAAHLGPAWSARPLSRAVMINLAPDRLGDLRDRLHGAGALLIDGLEDVPCREITQLEILAAAEAVAKRGRPVVFTSRKPLVEPDGWLPSLRERILEGAHLPLHPPSPASRVRIARGVLGSWGLKRREDLSVRLIDGLGGGLGGLDTRITGMLARCRSISELPRVEMPGGPQQRGPRAAPRAVVALVSRHFRLRPAELRGTSRSPRVTLPRQIAMYLLRRQCELSYPEIAQRFHRHHTTAMHACRRISAQRQASSDLESTLRLLENALGAIGKTGG